MSDYKQKYLKYKKKYLDLKEQSGGDFFYTDLIKFDGKGKNYDNRPVSSVTSSGIKNKEIISITIGIKRYMSQPKFYITVKKWNTDNPKIVSNHFHNENYGKKTFREETKTYDISIIQHYNKVCEFPYNLIVYTDNNERLSFSFNQMIKSKDRNGDVMTFEKNNDNIGFIWNIENMKSNLLDEKINNVTVKEIMNNSLEDLRNFYEKFPRYQNQIIN